VGAALLTLAGLLLGTGLVVDRRSLGPIGTLDPARYVESLKTLIELAPDLEQEVFRILAWNELGRVSLMRAFGTREGGPFENVYAQLFLVGADRIERIELFDVADADRALARFEELCADAAIERGE
jgi:hypothetical protein